MSKKIDVVFVNPGDIKRVYQQFADTLSAIEPPIFCRILADFLRRKGLSVQIIDVPAEKLTAKEAAKIVIDLNPKLVAMVIYGFQPSASTHNMQSAGDICRSIKDLDPTQKIIMTGTHPAALPERTLTEEAIDFVCTGEGPITIWQLAEAIKSKDVDYNKVGSLCYQANGQVLKTKNATLIDKLDKELPGTAWDLLDMSKYRSHNWHGFGDGIRTPYASIHTTLGCPYRCSFCCINTPFSGPNYIYGGPTYRFWSLDHVIKEIDFLVEQYGVRRIKIADEMFVLNPNHVLGLCERLIKRHYKDLTFFAYARIDTLQDQFLEKLREAGIIWLGIGIESGSKHVRQGSDKKFKNEKDNMGVNENILRTMEKVKRAGISSICNYIVGLPDDTLETMQDTFNLAVEINSEIANFYSAMAYPGSPLYVMAEQKGYKLPSDPGGPGWIGYSQHSYETIPLPTDTVSAAEVLRFRDNAFMNYFTNPRYLEMIRNKFGETTLSHIKEMTDHGKPRRQLLGD